MWVEILALKNFEMFMAEAAVGWVYYMPEVQYNFSGLYLERFWLFEGHYLISLYSWVWQASQEGIRYAMTL